MPQEHIRTAVVGGTGEKVRRSRCVWMVSDFTVYEMSAGYLNLALSITGVGTPSPYGISQEWTRNPPGTPFDVSMEAGNSGDEICVYTNGSIALAECGGTIGAGQPVMCGTDARIVTAALGLAPPMSIWIIGTAQEAGAAGDMIRVAVGIYA